MPLVPRPFIKYPKTFLAWKIRPLTKFLFSLLFLTGCYAKVAAQSGTQTHLQVVNGAVRVTNAELVLGNSSSTVNGYLYNSGGGTTTFTTAKTARVNLGLENARSLSSWQNATINSTDKLVLNTASGNTQAIIYTLPAAGSINAGGSIIVGDASGVPGAGIQVAPAGSDVINGAGAATAAFTSPYFQVQFVSDGVSHWYYTLPAAPTVTLADATHAGIISLGNQTLGTGIKTVQELATTGAIDLPATTSSSTGVINLNGSSFIHSFGGYTNVFAGNNSGNFSLTAGSAFYSTGFGFRTLNSLTTGSQNAAFGGQAGQSVTSGYQNSFLGYGAGGGNTTGSENTFVGFGAGPNNIDGSQNLFVGWEAGMNSYGGSYSSPSSNNIMIGYKSGSNVTFNGSNNVIIGNYGLAYPVSAPNNKFCVTGGFSPYTGNPFNLIYGDFNSGQVQINALSQPVLTPSAAFEIVSSTGGFLVPRISQGAFGSIANKAKGLMVYDTALATFMYYDGTAVQTLSGTLTADATHPGSVSLGNQTLGSGIKTVQELAVQNSLDLPPTNSNTTGVVNLSGYPILHAFGSTTNCFLGLGAGNFSLTGSSAIFNYGIGYGSLSSLTTGSDNVAIGPNAGQSNSSGGFNIYLGAGAGVHNQDGIQNTFIGFNAGVNSYGGSWSSPSSNNVMIGYRSGSNISFNGNNNLFIGNFAGYYTSSPSNKLLIHSAVGSDYVSSSLLYGDFSTGQLQINGAYQPSLTPSAALEVVSTNRGFLQPKAAPSSISSPVEGLSVYNTATHTPFYYNGSNWTSNTLRHAIFSPSVGSSVTTLLNNNNIINPSGSLSILTITLPSSPVDGDVVWLTFKQPVTAITYSGGTVVNAPSTATQSQQWFLTYDQATGSWY